MGARGVEVGIVMPYKYRVWCPDCCGKDIDGCFEGGVELSEELYETVEAAAKAGRERIWPSIWEYDVVEVDDQGGTIKQLFPKPFKGPNDEDLERP